MLDEAAAAEIDLAATLPGIVAEELATHWQTTLDFLTIITRHWPAILAERGQLEPGARQAALLDAQAQAWAANPPPHRIWLVTAGGPPALTRLARIVATLPHGRVILPGYDDPRKLRQRLNANASPPLTSEGKADLLRKLDQRIEMLLRKAIRQAGFPEAMAQHAELDWRSSGFWPGVPLASQYTVPEQHRRYRRLHVRITWRTSDGQMVKVPGPICIGGGKYSGIGLFAALDETS